RRHGQLLRYSTSDVKWSVRALPHNPPEPPPMLANQLDSAADHLHAHTGAPHRPPPVPAHPPLHCRRALHPVRRAHMRSRTPDDPRLSGLLDEERAVQPCRHPVYPPASSPLSRPRASSPAAPHPPRPSRPPATAPTTPPPRWPTARPPSPTRSPRSSRCWWSPPS